MKKHVHHHLDYGRYDSEENWNPFCSTHCRFFSDCPGKGGFCSLTELRELLPQPKNPVPSEFREAGEAYVHSQPPRGAFTEDEHSRAIRFWHFPDGRGAIQPWRRKLWELQNNSDYD